MRFHAFALCAALVAAPAAAEWVNIGIWGNGILGQQALRHAADAADEAMGVDKKDARSSSPAKAGGRSSALSFARSAAMTEQIENAVATRLDEMVSLRFRMEDPSNLVKGAGVRTVYRQALNARNLPEDSVSGATALFLSVGWELANGRTLSPAQNAAIFRQTSEGLLSTPLARASNAKRQEEADMRLIIASLWLEEAQARAESKALRRDMAESVRRDLIAITGNDMLEYAVTAKGFTER